MAARKEEKQFEQKYKDTLLHLKIISTWAAVGVKYRGIEPECCERAVGWIDDAIKVLEMLKEKSDERV